MSRALVTFKNTLPEGDFDIIIAPRALTERAKERGTQFEALEDLVVPGSVQDASAMAREVSKATHADGVRVAKSKPYKGYELWWMHYDELYYKYCLPFTEFEPLLKRLTRYEYVEIHTPPAGTLFRHYLDAYNVPCVIKNDPAGYIFPPTLWVQLALTVLSVPWLLLRRPKVMLTTSDLFDPPRDHDFRLRYIYEELHQRRISFVECIRSGEGLGVLLRHAWVRRRPVLYTHALTQFVYALSGRGGGAVPEAPAVLSSQEKFHFLLAAQFVPLLPADQRAIRLMTFIFRLIGVRAGIVNGVNSRNFRETIASKLAGAPVLGVLHGAPAQSYVVFEFMPEYDGGKALGADRYGIWSAWWREYFIAHSKVYRPEQLFLSGPMRPVEGKDAPHLRGEKYKVLFASEQLAAPQENMPYLDVLLARDDMEVYFKFRSYRDRFEEWLRNNRPDVLAALPPERILTGTMGEAVAACDVVVGSHTTGVLEALLYLRPFIFFKTKKWGDYFQLKERIPALDLYVENPDALVERIRTAEDISQDTLKDLQEKFFGNPRQNGSAWVVDQVEEILKRRT